MMFKKPEDVTYTQMAIFIDENVYREDLDEETKATIFKYLYFLSNMLAAKARFFTNGIHYEEFSLYVASYVYLRLTNKKQYQLKSDGTPKMVKIKSCLNYLKRVLYPQKVDFQQKFYSQTNINLEDEDNTNIGYTFLDKLVDSTDSIKICEFKEYLGTIESSIRKYLLDIPYKNNKVEWENIYLSCLLTFLNSITFDNETRNSIRKKMSKDSSNDYLLEKFYKKQSSKVVLYNVNDNMKNYIFVLTNEMRHFIAKDLMDLLKTEVTSQSNIMLLLDKELNGYGAEDL